MLRRTLPLCVLLAFGCDDGTPPSDADGGIQSGDAAVGPPSLETDAVVSFGTVYEAVQALAGRDWIPTDLSVSPEGELWVVQRIERTDRFDDTTECTSATGGANDCQGLEGSTVTITDPANPEPATGARARLVVDGNAWHFMRRPSAIAFGAPELTIEPGDPGAADPSDRTRTLLTEPMVLTNTFATCHEHFTGNFTDSAPYIGPTLWTADPEIYRHGGSGSEVWMGAGVNGSHLDMLHATQYCMGIAFDDSGESGSVYWTFNGQLGTLDRYDFGVPHVPGHDDHDDGALTRFDFPEDRLSRVVDVPSNLDVSGNFLYIADTGNGRVVRLDRTDGGTVSGSIRIPEAFQADYVDDVPLEEVIGRDALAAEWGGDVHPSGLAVLDGKTLVIGSHATGHLTLVSLEGEVLRTIDTGTGPGIGGLAVLDGVIYFTQMAEGRVYRVDVDESTRATD